MSAENDDRTRRLRMVIGQTSMEQMEAFDDELAAAMFAAAEPAVDLVRVLRAKGFGSRDQVNFLVGMAIAAVLDE